MDFRYQEAFKVATVEAYQRLILDCMRGDATLFLRRDAVELAWWLVMPVLERWQKNPTQSIPTYESGTWGPPEADVLLIGDGHEWRRP